MAEQNPQSESPKEEPEKTYVATIRTALSGPEDCIVKRLPPTYAGATVEKVLAYATDRKQLKEDEVATARSIEAEMTGQYTVSVNGQAVNVKDGVANLFEARNHRGTEFEALDIEVASVQEGGLENFLI